MVDKHHIDDVKCFGVTGFSKKEVHVCSVKNSLKTSKFLKMTLQEDENQEEQEEEVEILLPNSTIVTHCILKNDIPRLTQCFENDTDPYKETVVELLNERDPDGKSPLDIAATLERADMMKELLQRGADVNSVSEKGVAN